VAAAVVTRVRTLLPTCVLDHLADTITSTHIRLVRWQCVWQSFCSGASTHLPTHLRCSSS
jgi:hypothetical protein